MRDEAFENVRDQIGVCGIWCGSCAVGNGSLREAALRYADVLESHGFSHWAPAELDCATYSRGHAVVAGVAACVGCRQNGGRDACEMRRCAAAREPSECAACDKVAACPHGEALAHMRAGARGAGLFVKTQPGEDRAFVQACFPGLVRSFPTCLLFLAEEPPRPD